MMVIKLDHIWCLVKFALQENMLCSTVALFGTKLEDDEGEYEGEQGGRNSPQWIQQDALHDQMYRAGRCIDQPSAMLLDGCCGGRYFLVASRPPYGIVSIITCNLVTRSYVGARAPGCYLPTTKRKLVPPHTDYRTAKLYCRNSPKCCLCC